MPLKNGRLTTQEYDFAKVLAVTGDRDYAMYRAGYKSSASTMKASDPAIQAVIRAERRAKLTLLDERAFVVIEECMRDGVANGTRLEAVKTLWRELREERADQAAANPDVDPAQLDAGQLDEHVKRGLELMATLRERMAQEGTIEGELVDDEDVFG